MTHYYSNSLRLALEEAYPEHNWEPWRFRQVPKHFWDNISAKTRTTKTTISPVVTAFLKHVAKLAGVRDGHLSDWYRVGHAEIGGATMRTLQKFGGLPAILRATYPEHNWNPSMFAISTKRSTQYNVKQYLEELYPLTGKLLLPPLFTYNEPP